MKTFHQRLLIKQADKFPSLSNKLINPLTPMGDQDRISPYNINTSQADK